MPRDVHSVILPMESSIKALQPSSSHITPLFLPEMFGSNGLLKLILRKIPAALCSIHSNVFGIAIPPLAVTTCKPAICGA